MRIRLPSAVSIATSDSGGGAGIQADLLTFAAHGVYGATVLAAGTAQNTRAVTAIETFSVGFLTKQIDAVFSDLRPRAVKIGMLFDAPRIRAVARGLRRHRARNVVLDPVMVAKSGARLLQRAAAASLKRDLLPLCDLVTPNLPEAAALSRLPVATQRRPARRRGSDRRPRRPSRSRQGRTRPGRRGAGPPLRRPFLHRVRGAADPDARDARDGVHALLGDRGEPRARQRARRRDPGRDPVSPRRTGPGPLSRSRLRRAGSLSAEALRLLDVVAGDLPASVLLLRGRDRFDRSSRPNDPRSWSRTGSRRTRPPERPGESS